MKRFAARTATFFSRAKPHHHPRNSRRVSHLRNRARVVHSPRVKTTLTILGISVIAIFSSACNTTIGMGRDLRIIGESMEGQAQKARGSGNDTSGAPVY